MPADGASLVALARQVGEHALPIFLATLVAAMALAGIAGWGLHRRRGGIEVSDDATPPRLGKLALAFGSGFVLILCAASLFVAIGVRIDPDNAIGRADQALADAIAVHTPRAVVRVFAGLTHLGDPVVLAALGVAVAGALWHRRARLLAAGWALALAGNAVLNPLLKGVFERVRPVHDHGLAVATGYSFPSGHSSGAMVAFAMLLYLGLRLLPGRWHGAVAMGAVGLIVAIGCSRIFLRVHFASDVAAGLLSGLCWAGVCVAGLEFARARDQYSQKMR